MPVSQRCSARMSTAGGAWHQWWTARQRVVTTTGSRPDSTSQRTASAIVCGNGTGSMPNSLRAAESSKRVAPRQISMPSRSAGECHRCGRRPDLGQVSAHRRLQRLQLHLVMRRADVLDVARPAPRGVHDLHRRRSRRGPHCAHRCHRRRLRTPVSAVMTQLATASPLRPGQVLPTKISSSIWMEHPARSGT